MKAKVINTDFLHDEKYYSQNSIIDVPPDLIKKYPNNLLAVTKTVDDNISSIMVQDNSNANNMIVPSGIVKPKKYSKKNKR